MTALHPTPGPRAVVREQVRAVGLVLRAPAVAAAVVTVVATALAVGEFLTSGGRLDFAPELSMVPGIAALLFPIAVWRGEERFGAGLLWTLPVDRRRHALAKVLAGWAWLMAAVALFVLWLLVLSLLTGGDFLAERTVDLLPSPVVPPSGTLDAAALRAIRWAPSPLLWLAPFTGATGAYLVASAVAVGVRHPLRWIAGAVLAAFLLSELGLATHAGGLALAPARVFAALLEGPYGFDALVTARTESLHTAVTLAGGKTVRVWRALPDLGEWARATLLWTGAGVAALWAAASRHRERRRR